MAPSAALSPKELRRRHRAAERSFDWAGVATSGIEAGVGAAVGQATHNPFLGSTAALLAGATTRSALTGEDFGQSLLEEGAEHGRISAPGKRSVARFRE